MKKWYRTSYTKALLILLTIVMAAVFLASGFISVRIMPAESVENAFGKYEKNYLETENFENNFHIASMTILNCLRRQENFETEGAYDAQKIVDIEEYMENGTIDGKNDSGFAYKLSDLEKWSDEYQKDSIEVVDPIVVCYKPDGTYHYYRIREFEQLLVDRKLFLDDIGSISGFVEELENGYYSDSMDVALTDENGNVVYEDCWTFMDVLAESYAPEGANSIVDIVNSDPKWNGRLSEMYSLLTNTLDRIYWDISDYGLQDDAYHEGNTNYTYLIVDLKNQTVESNRSSWTDFADYEKYLKEIQSGNYKYCVIKEYLKDCKSNLNHFQANDWQIAVADAMGVESMKDVVFAAAVDYDLKVPDDFLAASVEYTESLKYQPIVGICMWTSLAVMLISMVCLTIICGRKNDDEEIHLHAFDKIPTEIAAVGVVAVWAIPAAILERLVMYCGGTVWEGAGYGFTYVTQSGYDAMSVAAAAVLGGWTGGMFLLGLLSLIRRIKGNTFWKNSVLRRICVVIGQFWKHRSITFRILMICGAFCVLHWIAMLVCSYNITFFHFLAVVAEVAAVIWIVQGAIAKDRIRKGLKEISEGNLDYQIPTAGMQKDYTMMADQINHIGDGLQNAVEQSMKDERMKTDLITNVSHDIKTPLTSIINYVDLLKRENFEDPKIQNYLEILEQKSQRLKQLTEDVVEASKASSGNITLECMNLNLVEMINQTEGEFEEKFAAKNLQSVLRLPEEPAMIYADGRRVWRILENIYNNVAKYAMPGTRVYADLTLEEKEVIFSLKNISEQPLNISADELTERFIRGDVSRGSEGSGLGLSIAKSLATLQGGTFNLYLDGDLFRVTIAFPRVK